MIRGLQGWLADLKEKRQAVVEALEEMREPTLPELLSRYMSLRQEERTGWTGKGRLKGSVADFNKVMEAVDFLKEHEITTVESLDTHLEAVSQKAAAIRQDMKGRESRIKAIDTMLRHTESYEAGKPVQEEYAAIFWKGKKQKFADSHKPELDAYFAAVRYLKIHLDGKPYSTKALKAERSQLAAEHEKGQVALAGVQADVKILRDVRHWINKVLAPEKQKTVRRTTPVEPQKKESIVEKLHEKQIQKNQKTARQPAKPGRKQDMEL